MWLKWYSGCRNNHRQRVHRQRTAEGATWSWDSSRLCHHRWIGGATPMHRWRAHLELISHLNHSIWLQRENLKASQPNMHPHPDILKQQWRHQASPLFSAMSNSDQTNYLALMVTGDISDMKQSSSSIELQIYSQNQLEYHSLYRIGNDAWNRHELPNPKDSRHILATTSSTMTT